MWAKVDVFVNKGNKDLFYEIAWEIQRKGTSYIYSYVYIFLK